MSDKVGHVVGATSTTGATDQPRLLGSWVEKIEDVLGEPAISHHRSYYEPGELDESAVVISVRRISAVEYADLASGRADYCSAVVPETS